MSIRARLAESNFVLMSVIAVLAIILLGFVNVSPAAAACGNGPPAVSTDKADYAASETAAISGSGFDCAQQLSVLVTRPDGSSLSGAGTGSTGPDLVLTDDNGAFVLSYHLAGTLPGGGTYAGQLGTYSVVVMNASGVVLATTTFADSQGLHACALTTGGGVKCWGLNQEGELGNGSFTDSTTPVNVNGLASGVVQVTVGYQHTCALTAGGGVKCWGYNGAGQLGDGTLTIKNTPVDVSGLTSGVVQISAGHWHTCAVLTTGGVKCWGDNTFGGLGDGTLIRRTTPNFVSGLTGNILSPDVAQISAGYMYTCALTTTGGAKCWGNNAYGQLGNNAVSVNQPVPVDVSGLTSGVTQISTAGQHTCALTTSGGVKCWGDNANRQLGDGTFIDKITPIDVSGLTSGVTQISTGFLHTCALTTSGGVKCWGHNGSQQLGDGTTIPRATPVDVIGLTSGVAQVSLGHFYSCAMTVGGGAKCWGHNAFGQLGNGTLIDSGTPVNVTGLTSGVIALPDRLAAPQPPLVITINGTPAGGILFGAAVSLTAVSSGGTSPLTLSWKKNGVSFDGASSTVSDTPFIGSTTYQVTVTDALANQAIATTVVNVFDFLITLSPADRSVLRGGSTSFTVSATLIIGSAGAPGSADIGLAGLPAGASMIGVPALLPLMTTGSSATFTVQTGPSALGDFTLTSSGAATTGAGSSLKNSSSVSLHIYDFTLALSPADRTALRGTSTGYTVTAALVAGSSPASANLALAHSGLPADAATLGFPTSLSLPGSADFTVQIGPTVLGDFAFTVAGSAAGNSRSAHANLHIFDYTISLSPLTRTVLRNCVASYDITVALRSGSTVVGLPGSLALTVSGAPPDATLTLPASTGFPQNFSATTAATLTVATGGASLGDSTLVVTGSVTGGSRSQNATLSVYDYAISVSPGPLLIARNQSGSYTVALTLAAGSAAPPSLGLTVTGFPAGATATFNSTSLVPPTSTLLVIAPIDPSATLLPGSFTLTVSADDGSPCGRTATAQLNIVDALISSQMRDTNCSALPNGADVVFTPPNGSLLKLTATNPGGYMYNAGIQNTGSSASTVGLVIDLPLNEAQDASLLPPGSSAFALWGSNPVKIFTGNPCAPGATDITPAGITVQTSTGPVSQPLSTNSTVPTGPIVVPALTIPSGDTIWVQVHNRYALIGSTAWPASSQTTFVRGYQAKTRFTGGLALTNPAVTNFTETGKKVTAIGGYTIDLNGVAKGGLGIAVDALGTTCSSPSLLAAQNVTGFYFITVPAGTASTVRVCSSLGTQVAQQTFTAVAQDEFRQLDFTNLNPADPVIHGIVGTSASGIPNVRVDLYGSGNRLLATTMTNSGGYYVFRFTPAGNYTVKIAPPAGYIAIQTAQSVFVKMFDTMALDFGLTQ